MCIIKKLIKHDQYLEQLCGEIESRYDVLIKNLPLYSKRKRLIGEIDILAVKEDYCDIYEVKCSHRIAKAKRQLNKFKRIVSPDSKVRNLFFFCGQTGKLESL